MTLKSTARSEKGPQENGFIRRGAPAFHGRGAPRFQAWGKSMSENDEHFFMATCIIKTGRRKKREIPPVSHKAVWRKRDGQAQLL